LRGFMLVLWVSFLVVLFDQWTKQWAEDFLRFTPVTLIPGWLDYHYVQNTGAAWGIFQGFSHWLVVLSIVMLAVLVMFRRQLLSVSLLHRLTMGLLIGGIVGNLIDRIRLSYVIDFVHAHWGERYHFPSFNIADAAICAGVFIYVAASVFEKRADLVEPDADSGKTG
jgi:signal peptidase II